MAALLKQSTTVTIRLGPFIDKTDGFTEETGLGSMGIEVSKNHAAFGARSSATATAHDAEGWYSCELNTTDTGTLGPLIVKAHDSATHLPVWREFLVVPANVYDSLVAGSDALDVSTIQFNGSAVVQSGGRPEVNTTHFGGTSLTQSGGRPEVNTTHISADSVAADRLEAWLDGMVTGTADSGSTTTVVDAERTEADTDYWTGSIILFTSGSIAGQARIITDFNAGTDTITFLPPTTQAVGTNTYIIIPGGTVNVEGWNLAQVNALISGRVDTTVGAMQSNVVTASAIATDAIDADAIAPDAIGSSELAASAVTEIQSGLSTLDAAGVRSAVGLASANLDTQLDALPTAAENADAVWDEDATAHQTQGTFGQAIGDPVADTNTIFKATVTDASGATVGVDTAAILDDTGTSGVVVASIAANAINASALTDGLLGVQKNAALNDFTFVMIDSTDHISPKTGLTISGTRSIDGGAFGAVGGSFAEIGNGVYQFDAAAADTNGDMICWRFTGTGADATIVHIKTIP